jgi:hypothetical protein
LSFSGRERFTERLEVPLDIEDEAPRDMATSITFDCSDHLGEQRRRLIVSAATRVTKIGDEEHKREQRFFVDSIE